MFSSTQINQIGQQVSNSLVSEQILTSAQSTINFNNLDGLADGGYTLELGLIAGATNSVVGLHLNGDTTLSNYYSEILNGTNTTANSSALNGSTSALGYLGAISTVGFLCVISVDIIIASSKVSWISTCSSYFNNEWMSIIGTRYQGVCNINSIVLQGYLNGGTSTQANVFGAGTTARLYRKKTATNSLISSGTNLLLSEFTASSAINGIQFNGLDGNLHGGYTIEADINYLSSVARQMLMYVNSVSTATNYYSSLTYTGINYPGNNNGGQSQNSPYVLYMGKILTHFSSIECRTSLTNMFRYSARFLGSDPSYMYGYSSEGYCTQSVSNITSLGFWIHDGSAQIGAGSRFRIYRRK